MNAAPHLEALASSFAAHGLEAILIGNAAAALEGAPVTTIDFDFLFRKTPANLKKLKRIADDLGAVVMWPYYPVSDLFRVIRDADSLQVDFMGTIHGAASFASIGGRASLISFGDHSLLVASLEDIIRSKRAANRPRDRAVLEILERTDAEKKAKQKSKARRP